MDYINDNLNQTKYTVAFCHEEWYEELEIQTMGNLDDMYNFSQSLDERSKAKTKKFQWQFPCQFEHNDHGEKDMWVYFMYFNMTLSPSNVYTQLDKPMNKDVELMGLKMGLDNALMEYKAKEKGLDYIPKIEMQVQSFPYVPDRVFKDLDVVSVYGAFYLIMVPLCTFMVVFDELMREKCDNLRLGMQVLGTQDNAYWVSWIVTGVIINAIMTFEMILAGRWY